MIDVIWGTTKDKPESSKILAESLSKIADLSGYLYIGYPIIGSPIGPIKFDALLVSKEKGLVGFDLVEGTVLEDYQNRQDSIASMLDVKLKPYPDLKQGRNLKFAINVVTFAPAKNNLPKSEGEYYIANSQSIADVLPSFTWQSNEETFSKLVAAIQVVTSIRGGKQKRDPKNANSRGARLKSIEDSIANLDQHQSQAVIETVEGVQRIRGLAGSGKTIILALKVAYLHSQNEDWKIAVTFNTRSLKEQFKRLITNFSIEQAGTEPDWEKIDILNAWGGHGDKERDGIYHKFCRVHEIPFIDFRTAKNRFGDDREFGGVCAEALNNVKEDIPLYDIILVDEAQDFPPEFLRLCYRFLKDPKRLVYAYDELQSLNENFVLPPETLFGVGPDEKPLVRLNLEDDSGPRQDIILEKCYRNSRPILATAHALGFGIYRKRGLVQFFEQDSLWTDVGYLVEEGELKGDSLVTLSRSSETSPLLLENHSPPEDLIQFTRFESSFDQTVALAESIRNDIEVEELRPEDIVVINPNPLTTQKSVGRVRDLLFEMGINSELAGVSTSTDIFTKSGAVTFTGIHRAKGNEAGMVYIINAQDCFSAYSKSHLSLVRNRLFTAITRSKAWVRVMGIGLNMDGIIDEWESLKNNDYKLKFTYPNPEEKLQLRLINKELTGKKRTKEQRLKTKTYELFAAVESGEIDADQLIENIRKLSTAKK